MRSEPPPRPVLDVEPEPSQAPNQLATIAKVHMLAKEDPLVVALEVFQGQLEPLLREASALTVTSAEEVSKMKRAKLLAGELKRIRCAIENVRKDHGAELVRKKKAIDALANWGKDLIEPAETRMKAMAEFAERLEEAKIDARTLQREKALEEFAVETRNYRLREMEEEAFQTLLRTSRIAHEAAVAQAAKEYEERKAAEAARVAEQKRLREENERLRKEQYEREAEQYRIGVQIGIEQAELKAAHERRIAEERAARAQAEAIAKAQRDAQAKADADAKAKIAAEEKALKKAAAAPDAEKLIQFANDLDMMESPKVKTVAANDVVAQINGRLEALAEWIRNQARALG